MRTSPQVRWAAREGMWSFGAGTPRAFLAASLAYDLRGGVAEKITCPVFVGRAESDKFFRGQPEELMEHLTAPATLASFTDAEGARAHRQVGAQRLLSARMLDWLEETLTRIRGPVSTSPEPAVKGRGLPPVGEDAFSERCGQRVRADPGRGPG